MLAVPILLTSFVGLSQNTKTETVEYRYIQPPTEPLNPSIKNYQSSIVANYAAANQEKKDAYEKAMAEAKADFEREEAAYPAKVKAAEDKYAAEMKAWDEKSLADKVVEQKILNENNKPVKQIPSPPYLKSVQEPKLQREYDNDALANTYLVLDGYQNVPDNAVSIEVILYGFESTNPRVVSEQKSILQNGVTKNVTYYHVEFTYRHTMSVRVKDPSGTELFYLTPSELNNYSKYASSASTTSPSINTEQLITSHEEEILQKNLELINNMVNDRIGWKKQPRTTSLVYVQEKNGEYADVLEAFNTSMSGLTSLIDTPDAAEEKLNKAIGMYEAILMEAEIDNKKARINAKVAFPMYFNLLECLIATKQLDKAEARIQELNKLSLDKGERKQKEDFESLIVDLRKRVAANK